MIAITFVCMGNICRSPALAAVFLHLVQQRGVADRFFVDSSGMTSYYLGRPADPRISQAAHEMHIDIDHRAQLFDQQDFKKFDYIFAATHEVEHLIQTLATNVEERKKVFLSTAFSQQFKDQEIPDPFYLEGNAFEHVMLMAFDACEGILDHLLKL